MSNKKNNLQLLATVAFAIILVVFTFQSIITNPGHVIINLTQDAAKNYFTYLYHIMYEKGIWSYGMNYPYGEHMIYTDGQPFLSVPLSYLHIIFHMSINQALAIMHLLIGLSYVLAVVFIYKILLRYNVSFLPAMIFSGLITFFSPQVLRVFGHYGLSYCNVIPMFFYWSIKYYDTDRLKYPVFIFLLGSIISFSHPYFIALSFLWVFFYILGYIFFIRKKSITKFKHILPLFFSIISIFAVFKIVMLFTDPVKDRPGMPWGVLSYTTTYEQIFTSTFSPFWDYINKNTSYHNISYGGEGYIYPGLVVIFTTFISFISAVVLRIKRKKSNYPPPDNIFPRIWMFIAISSLLIGMGAPFIWHMQWLMDYLSIFRQFRTLGRFSWIFYYIISIYSVVVLYKLFVKLQKKKYKFTAYALLTGSILIWCWEATGYIHFSQQLVARGHDNFNKLFSTTEKNWQLFLDEKNYKTQDFQAVLLLPFFHIGSEKLSVGNDDGINWILVQGIKASIQMHLPVIDALMSRSSWSQAFKQVKIVAGPFSDKPILQKVNNKPFLLIYATDDYLDEDTKYLLQASDFIGFYSGCNVYACYPERIKNNDTRNKNSVLNEYNTMHAEDTCYYLNGYTSYKSAIINSKQFFIDHFDNGTSKEKLFGNGAAKPVKEDEADITTFTLSPSRDSEQYEFSIWALLNNVDYRCPAFRLNLLDSAEQTIFSTTIFTKQSVDNIGMWFRTSAYISIPAKCKKIKCTVINTQNPSYLALDEMMMRPAESIIISKFADGTAMVNNHVLKKQK